MYGIVVFLAGFTLKSESTNLSSVLLPASMTSGTNPVYTLDGTREKAYYSTGEELCILGVVLIGISAFRGDSRQRRD